ncbi:hypothetical protein LX32DRAFT_252362 [Colletotrichum zoysiae]|uniref:Uncharacterized protein n=1 Tax=Colletotrichum zoysiae TaxID=1216348 RepID=A0AAD9HTL1_9PEZI|nr:hypothetical protein LX32DRAFT_252362 [Colletotrichum zoysiae]
MDRYIMTLSQTFRDADWLRDSAWRRFGVRAKVCAVKKVRRGVKLDRRKTGAKRGKTDRMDGRTDGRCSCQVPCSASGQRGEEGGNGDEIDAVRPRGVYGGNAPANQLHSLPMSSPTKARWVSSFPSARVPLL